jgi:hypothetical protein
MDDDYDYDDGDDRMPEGALWCDRCQGSGIANCYCGGDQCYCLNCGEMECPTCHGEGFWTPTAAQIASWAALREVMKTSLSPAPAALPVDIGEEGK